METSNDNSRANLTVYLTRSILERVRSYETATFQFNHALTDDYLSSLDPGLKLPVVQAFSHKQYDGPYQDVMRVMVVIPKNGVFTTQVDDLAFATVDMPIEEYLALPIADAVGEAR